MRLIALLPLLALVAGCTTPAQPVVDLTGVDMGRYSQDLAACDRERYETGFSVGNPISNCMERKGYKVLVRN